MIDARSELAAALADRYLVAEELGRGASATVYRARDRRHERWVALKVLHSRAGSPCPSSGPIRSGGRSRTTGIPDDRRPALTVEAKPVHWLYAPLEQSQS